MVLLVSTGEWRCWYLWGLVEAVGGCTGLWGLVAF